uniref:Uncharacterized protein n=1 Tax=Mus spicilegus TaxID=10103 RepID=A0A8C6HHJ6_MUSSI
MGQETKVWRIGLSDQSLGFLKMKLLRCLHFLPQNPQAIFFLGIQKLPETHYPPSTPDPKRNCPSRSCASGKPLPSSFMSL